MDAFWGAFGGGLAAGLLVVFLSRVTDRRRHRLSLYLDLIPNFMSINNYNERLKVISELDRTASLAGRKIQNLWSSVSAEVRKYNEIDLDFSKAAKSGPVDVVEVKAVLEPIHTSVDALLDELQAELKKSLGSWWRT